MPLDTLIDRFGSDSGYRCTFCGQTYDSERLNCHACGVDAVTKRA
jgi:DNA-directed RNA polymerase subunit RPC12/RpoP